MMKVMIVNVLARMTTCSQRNRWKLLDFSYITYVTKIASGGHFVYNAGYIAYFVANLMRIKKILSHNSGIGLQLRYGQFSERWYVRNFDVVNASRKMQNHEY